MKEMQELNMEQLETINGGYNINDIIGGLLLLGSSIPEDGSIAGIAVGAASGVLGCHEIAEGLGY
ncbi:hypothetical protein [Clostridium sp.]|uniref:hypothetical protein n=1 Tax=Clostridium sp. TaxID=1506 RepID=UPI00399624E7